MLSIDRSRRPIFLLRRGFSGRVINPGPVAPTQTLRTINHPFYGVLYCKSATLCTPNPQGGVHCESVEVCQPAGSTGAGEAIVRFSSTPSSPRRPMGLRLR